MSVRFAALALVGALALAACSGSSSTKSSDRSVTTTSTAATATTANTTSTSLTAVAKVSANTASREQLVAALDAAGVPNSSRWAGEIVEYRPYPANDPSLAKLRQNLAKYNPSADTLERILSALQP